MCVTASTTKTSSIAHATRTHRANSNARGSSRWTTSRPCCAPSPALEPRHIIKKRPRKLTGLKQEQQSLSSASVETMSHHEYANARSKFGNSTQLYRYELNRAELLVHSTAFEQLTNNSRRQLNRRE